MKIVTETDSEDENLKSEYWIDGNHNRSDWCWKSEPRYSQKETLKRVSKKKATFFL